MRKTKQIVTLVLLISLLAVLPACLSGGGSNEGTNNRGGDPNTENVSTNNSDSFTGITLKMASPDSPQDFEKWYRAPLAEKFPEIRLEHIFLNVDDPIQVQQMIAGGDLPDLIRYNHSGTINLAMEYNLAYDMKEMVEASSAINFDDFREGFMNDIESYVRDGHIYGIPLRLTTWVTLYNKDIFDLFGEPYPTDNMTWDEMIALGSRMTREVDGIQYRGLVLGWEEHPRYQFGTQVFHPETDHPQFLDDPTWVEYFDFMGRIFSIPGNYPNGEEDTFQLLDPFLVEQNIAMIPHYERIADLNNFEINDASMNWDMVTYPYFEGNPIMPHGGGPLIGITDISEYKEEAFAIVEYLLSEEYQTILAMEGFIPSLATETIIENFAANLHPAFQEKNLEAMFKLEYPPLGPVRQNTYPIDGWYDVLLNGIRDLANGEKDTNTILREVQERIEIVVQRAQAAQ